MKYFEGLDFIAWGAIPDYDFFVIRGYRQPNSAERYPGEVVDFGDYGLQFNYSGRFSFSVGNRPARLYEGAYAWITLPREKVKFGSPKGESRHHRHVNFMGARIGAFIERGLLPSNVMTAPITITRPDLFARQFDDMLERLRQQRFQHATHLLEGLLFTMQHQPPAAGDYLTPKIRKLASEITKDPGRAWNFETEARGLSVSYDHFRRMFRKTVHTAPGKFLLGSRLQRAAELLRSSTKTITEISDAVGIPDQHYFTRLFSRQYKMPPAKYRQHLNEVTPP